MLPLRLWMGRLWKLSIGILFFISIFLLCRAEPEAKKYGLALLVADLAQGWLALHNMGVAGLLKTWEFDRKWQRRSILPTLQVLGGITLSVALVSLGAFILFAETCLPFKVGGPGAP